MKYIVFVIESLHLGGAEKSLITLLNSVDLSMHHVEVWVNATGGALESQLPSYIILKQIPRRTPSLLERGYYFMLKNFISAQNYNSSQIIWRAFSRTYLSTAKEFDVAIAYHQGLPTYYILDKIKAKRKIGWLNTDYHAARYNTHFDLPVFTELDQIVAVSDYAKKTLTTSFPHEDLSAKVVVVEDFIDQENINRLAIESRQMESFRGIKLVTVGRLNVTKGYHLAVEAAKILRDSAYDFKWFIVGEGDQRKAITKLIDEYKLGDHVLLLGADANPYPYMRAADIYVQTSVLEGFSISVREAKILNKPIVCTNFPSISGALEDGVNALIAEMNAQSIADKIIMLIEKKTLRVKFAKHLSVEQRNKEQCYEQQIIKIIEN